MTARLMQVTAMLPTDSPMKMRLYRCDAACSQITLDSLVAIYM